MADVERLVALNRTLTKRLALALVAMRAGDLMRSTVPGHSGGDCVETDDWDRARAAFLAEVRGAETADA